MIHCTGASSASLCAGSLAKSSSASSAHSSVAAEHTLIFFFFFFKINTVLDSTDADADDCDWQTDWQTYWHLLYCTTHKRRGSLLIFDTLV